MSDNVTELEDLKKKNLSKLETLAQQNLALSVGDLAFLKMEALIELFITNEQDKLKFELLVEMKKKEIIDQVFVEIRKAQLLQNVGPATHKLNL